MKPLGVVHLCGDWTNPRDPHQRKTWCGRSDEYATAVMSRALFLHAEFPSCPECRAALAAARKETP